MQTQRKEIGVIQSQAKEYSEIQKVGKTWKRFLLKPIGDQSLATYFRLVIPQNRKDPDKLHFT